MYKHMNKRIDRLTNSAIELKCRECRRPLVKVDFDRLKRQKCYRNQVGPADLRPPLSNSTENASSCGVPLCKKCEDAHLMEQCQDEDARELAWGQLSDEQLVRFIKIIRKLLGLEEDVPVEDLFRLFFARLHALYVSRKPSPKPLR
jgi:hypothetical protein